MLVLLLWSIISPLHRERLLLATDQFGRPSASHGHCSSERFWEFFIPLASLNFAALIVANQQAYVARKISTEFAESDYIARAMSLIVIVAMLIVPVAMMSDDNTNLHFFVSVSFVSTVALSLVLYIFVPKILYHREKGSIAKAIRGSIMTPPTRLSTEASSHQLPVVENDASIGELVIVHPKLAAGEKTRIKNLEQENEKLRRRVACLEAASSAVDLREADLSENAPNHDVTDAVECAPCM